MSAFWSSPSGLEYLQGVGKEHFGHFVKVAATAKGLSVPAAASKYNISRSTMYRVVEAESAGSFDASTLLSVAHLCGISVQELIERFSDMPTMPTPSPPEDVADEAGFDGIREEVDRALTGTPYILEYLRHRADGDPQLFTITLDSIRGAFALLADDQASGIAFNQFTASLGFQLRTAKTPEQAKQILERSVDRLLEALIQDREGRAGEHETK
ncbi:MAG: hypothetical protein AAF432_00530 [Planctomycetota bacterium]